MPVTILCFFDDICPWGTMSLTTGTADEQRYYCEACAHDLTLATWKRVAIALALGEEANGDDVATLVSFATAHDPHSDYDATMARLLVSVVGDVLFPSDEEV